MTPEETGTPAEHGHARLVELLPPIVLVYVWLFFPNVPSARLGPSEPDTVFFMGLCNLAFAFLLANRPSPREGGSDSGRASWWLHGLFHFGCIGLSASKETNVAPLLWMSIAYAVLLYVRGGRSWKTLLGAAPLAALSLFTLERVYATSSLQLSGYGEPFSIGRTAANAKKIAAELFQTETSLAATAGLVVLAAALLAAGARILRSARGGGRPGRDFFFVLFLLGQFASLYAVLSISWGVVTRYWYPLVPCFAMLLAFGARFVLLAAGRASKALARAAAAGLAGFVLFFVSVNYHDFLYQTIVQHGLRDVDERLISTITRLLDDGETVEVLAKTRPWGTSYIRSNQLKYVYSDFSPGFHDRVYGIRDHSWRDDATFGHRVAWRIHRRDLPFDRRSPPWVVAPQEESVLSGEEVAVISPREDYRILSWTGALAGLLQGTPAPHLHHDGGVSPLHGDHYRWIIYRSTRLEDLSTAFRSRLVGRLAEAEPVIDSEYGVYHLGSSLVYVAAPARFEYDVARAGNVLTYSRDGACGNFDEPEARFFLHVHPVDKDVLSPPRRRHGFDNLDFRFHERAWEDAGRCTAVIDLPEYDVERISTGQFVSRRRGGARVYEHLWSVEILEHEQSTREPCNNPRIDGRFFLRLYPTDAGDLAPPRRRAGFESRVFELHRQGFENDGRCIAVIGLPEYGMERIVTGRRKHGKTVWKGEFSPLEPHGEKKPGRRPLPRRPSGETR